jgi:hypothetical protein
MTKKSDDPSLDAWRARSEREARARPTPSDKQLADALKRIAQEEHSFGWLGGSVLGEADKAENKPFDSKGISEVKHQAQKRNQKKSPQR